MPVQPGSQVWRRQWRLRQTPQHRSEKPYIVGVAGGPQGYFVDQYGNPRMILGDAIWGLCGNAGRWNGGNWRADFDQFVANRAAQGFTALYGKPMGTTQNLGVDDNGGTFDALFPFQGGAPTTGTAAANPSTGLTAPYWQRIDYFLNACKVNGITVFFNAIGYNSDFNGGPGPLNGKSAAEFQSYGSQLGARYKSQPNLVWMQADDYFGGADSLLDGFLTGVRSSGDTHIISVQNMPESGSRATFDAPPTTLPWGTTNGQFNFVYSYNQEYYGVERAYAESYSVPIVAADGYFHQGNNIYSGGSGAFAFDQAYRQAAWWSLASGARGFIHGSDGIWQYQNTALASSGTDWFYVNNAKNIRAVVESLPGWQNLFPDLTSQFVVGGRGTRASPFVSGGSATAYEVSFTSAYVAASITPDGSLALLYLPRATTITIDQSRLGQGYTATWIDPVTGVQSSAGTGATYNSTAKGNNSQGDPDWVLAFQGPSVNSPVRIQPSSPQWRRKYRIAQQVTQATLQSTSSSNIPLTDSGTGTDVLAFTIQQDFPDSGTATDALAITQPTDFSDTGTGADSLAIVQPTPLTDTGAASDTFAVTQPTPLTDTGSALDVFGVSVPVTFTDTGTAADVLGIMPGLTESGVGSDSLVILIVTPIPLTDAGTATDSLGIMSGLTDSGSATDSISIASGVPLSEVGAASDALGILPGLAESGTATDSLAVLSGVPFSDAGSASDALGVMPGLTDSGTGTDSINIVSAQPIALADSGAASDVLAIQIITPISLSESGTGTDSLAIVSLVSLAESGVATDAMALTSLVPFTDTGSASDVLLFSIPISLAETGHGTDSLNVITVIVIALTESGSASDVFAFTIGASQFPGQVTVSNSAAGSVTTTIQPTGGVTIGNRNASPVSVRNST